MPETPKGVAGLLCVCVCVWVGVCVKIKLTTDYLIHTMAFVLAMYIVYLNPVKRPRCKPTLIGLGLIIEMSTSISERPR